MVMKVLFSRWNVTYRTMLHRSVSLPLCLCARLLKCQHWTLVTSSLHRQCNHGNVDTIVFCVSTKYVRHCQFSTSSGLGVGYKLKNNLSDCYSLLNISEDAALAEVREAYIKCAKLYHPDSGSTTADPKKFTQVKEAYKTILVGVTSHFLTNSKLCLSLWHRH